MHETFANEYVNANDPKRKRGMYIGPRRIVLDQNGNVDVGQSSEQLKTILQERNISKAYGTLSRTVDKTSGHVVFFTVDDNKVTIYDPNGRSAVFLPDIKTDVSLKLKKTPEMVAALDKVRSDTDELNKLLKTEKEKLSKINSTSLKTPTKGIQQSRLPSTPLPKTTGKVVVQTSVRSTPGRRKANKGNVAYLLSDDLDVIAPLTPMEAQSLSTAHDELQQYQKQNEKVLQLVKKQSRLKDLYNIEVNILEQRIRDLITSNVSKHFETLAMTYVSYGIIGGEGAISVVENIPDGTFTVTFAVRCIPNEQSKAHYEGYSDSWVDAHIHFINEVLDEKIEGVTIVSKDTRVRRRKKGESKTVAATEYFCDGFDTVFATVPNMNFSIGKKSKSKVSNFLQGWMGEKIPTDVNGICATLVMLFLKNYVQTGDVRTAGILNDTKTLFFRKEDGELLLMLYLLGQMSGPMIELKDKLLPVLRGSFSTQMIKDFSELQTFDVTIEKVLNTKAVDEQGHPYQITGAHVPTTRIYALGDLGSNDDIKRIRTSLGFIDKKGTEEIQMF